MTFENRVEEIMSQITAFSVKEYTRTDYLPELLKLQKETVDLTFNAEQGDNTDLRLWDVERHLRKMNEERGHIADEELDRFVKGCKTVCNNISAEFSGRRGEQIVFKALENLACQNKVLHNVELEFDGRRTEIDALVFTNHAVFIIEIKNSKKNIFIDSNGEFFRNGHSMHYDCNIADKMNERESMLRKTLERAGMEYLKIFKIVTFTNSRIDVENKYRYIKVCGVNYLSTFIEKFTSRQWYTYEDMCIMSEAVTEAKCPDEYLMTIDMNEFKRDFAVLMAKLEASEETENEPDTVKEMHERAEKTADNEPVKKKQNDHKYGKGVAAAVGITLVNVAIVGFSRLLKR